MASADTDPLSDLPAQVSRVLKEFIDAAQTAFTSDLKSVILYGSAAEGRLRATSDVNIILLLTRFDPTRSEALREPLRVAQAAIRLNPMFVTEAELPAAVINFAEKFADILRRRRILFGADPFTGVTIPREVVIARLGQVLLNLVLRLRAAYVLRGLREEQLALAVADATGPLRSAAATLSELQGKPVQSGKEALDSFVKRTPNNAWHEVLPRLSQARETRLLPPGVAGPTMQHLFEIACELRSEITKLR
jgi:predicted nucleotidyltransferase